MLGPDCYLQLVRGAVRAPAPVSYATGFSSGLILLECIKGFNC